MAFNELDTLLTENEKSVYLSLLQIGESTASPLLKKTGLQNSVFYRTINRLLEKGFVTYILKGKIKHFRAASPKLLLHQIKEEKRKIEEIVPKLNKLHKESLIDTQAEVYVGVKGIRTMFLTLFEDYSKNELYRFFSPRPSELKKSYEEIYLWFREYRTANNIKAKGIHPIEHKRAYKKNPNTQEKFVNFPLPSNMGIFRNKIAMITWGEIPSAILIQSKEISSQYKEMFEEIWKNSKS